MKRWVFVVSLLLFASALTVPILLDAQPSQRLAGHILIPAADIRAEVVKASHGSACGCCGMLYNGGIVHTTADLSAVQLYDMACLITVDGDSMALECVEIIPCLRVGRWLIGLQGVILPEGDVLVVSRSRVYRFARL